MASAKFVLVTCLLGVALPEIHGHGMMLDPISRSSAWRKGFPVEPNYTDNELFCGGRQVQFAQNGGRCGVCGDNYAMPRPRPNENTGVYGTGVIVRKYSPGQIADVYVKLTANHKGTFRFDLCPLNNGTELETEACFDRYPLSLANYERELRVESSQMEFHVRVRIPSITCEQCVLRWTYRTGNHWGSCEDGSFGLGCGPQEYFKNCADVTIDD